MGLVMVVCILYGLILGFSAGVVYAIYTDYIDISDIHWDINYAWTQDDHDNNRVYVDNYSKWTEDYSNE